MTRWPPDTSLKQSWRQLQRRCYILDEGEIKGASTKQQNKSKNKQNKAMSQTSFTQYASTLLESLKLLDGNGAIDKKRVMDRNGIQGISNGL